MAEQRQFSKSASRLLNMCVDQRKLDACLLDTDDLELLKNALELKACLLNGAALAFPGDFFSKIVKKCNFEEMHDLVKLLNQFDRSFSAKYQDFLFHLCDTILDVKYIELCLELCERNNEKINGALCVKMNAVLKDSMKNNDALRVIPKYLKLIHGPGRFCAEIWTEIHKAGDMATICCLEDILLPLDGDFSVLITEEFWMLLQEYLVDVNGYNQKSAVYLLRRSFDAILRSNASFYVLDGLIDFSPANKGRLEESWKNLCVLFEVLREKQLHLIEPSLFLLGEIEIQLHPNWMVHVYQLLLGHVQISINYFAVKRILSRVWKDLNIFKKIAHLLLSSLNNGEYSHASKEAYASLQDFAYSLQKDFFVALVDISLKIKWTPVSLFCFYSAVYDKITFVFDSFELTAKMVSQVAGIPHKTIRVGCANVLAKFVCEYYPLKKDFARIASLFWGIKFVQDKNIEFARNSDFVFRMFITSTKPDFQELMALSDSCFKFETIQVALECKLWSISEDEVDSICANIHVSEAGDKLLRAIVSRIKTSFIFKYVQRRMESLVDGDDVKDVECLYYYCDKSNKYALAERATAILNAPHSFNAAQITFAFYIASCEDLLLPSSWIEQFSTSPIKLNVDICVSFLNLILHNENYTRQKMRFIFDNLYQLQDVLVTYNIITFIECLLKTETESEYLGMVEACFEAIQHFKHPSEIAYLSEEFVGGVVNKKDFLRIEVYKNFAVTALNTIQEFSKKFQRFVMVEVSDEIFVPYLLEMLLFEDVIRKHERAEYEICVRIRTHLSKKEVTEREMIYIDAVAQLINLHGESTADLLTTLLIEKYNINYNKRYFPDSQLCLQKMRIVQALLVVHGRCSNGVQSQLIELFTNSLCTESHQNCVKQLIQWLLILLLRNKEEEGFQLIKTKLDSCSKTQVSSIMSFVPVLYHLAINKSENFYSQLLKVLFPLTMGPHFKLRLYSQFAISKLYLSAVQRSFQQFTNTWNELFNVVEAVLASVEESSKFVLSKEEDFFDNFHPENHYSIESIYVFFPSINNVECAQLDLTDWGFNSKANIAIKSQLPNFKNSTTSKEMQILPKTDQSVTFSNIQKKIVPLHNTDTKKGSLIVITSLIESAANLGGLTRTCEIFGVGQMIVSDAKVVANKEFKGLSMSSEKWVDIVEVKEKDLLHYLAGLKVQEYKLVGVEQTANSTKLNEFTFPQKTALLLGNEKEGISPKYISLMDYCVEIPQFGVIRSLNVHVAGATFVWEYAKQHLL